MKRAFVLTLLVATGLVAVTPAVVMAQPMPAGPTAPPSPTPVPTPATESVSAPNWFSGQATLSILGRNDIESSKFQEYRVIPKGVSLPGFSFQGRSNGRDYALIAQNISQRDQRYLGWANVSWLGVSFDYNQIPHSIGNDGHSIMNEVAPGVWRMSSTLRQTLGNAVDTQLPTSTRTYAFYAALFAPTIAAANLIDLDGLRQRGSVEFDLGRKLPFDLKVSYMRELKTGTRGTGGGLITSAVNSFIEVPEPLNDLIQDLGFRATLNRDWGNLHAGFNHNWYNDRLKTLIVDNPLRASDQAWTNTAGAVPPLGGPAQARFVNPPDNSANTGSLGAQFKFAKQTRLAADVVLGRWTQNAQFYPFTINTTVLTPSGVRADSLAALQTQSLNGRIDSTTLNLSLTSRPIEGLGVRVRYRSYDRANKTPTFVRTGNVGTNPDRSFTTVTPTADAPLGWETANPYSNKTGTFNASVSYDIQAVTLEGAYRYTSIDRTYREATKGTESGATIAAVLRASDWLHFRGSFDDAKRKASGYDPAKSLGLQSDESERDSTRLSLEAEVNPTDKVGFVLAYARKNDDYPNRPNRIVGVANTQNGLLNAKYDTFTAEIDLTPTERADFSVYYTHEKNLSKTRYGSGAVINILDFVGSDRTDTFGANTTIHIVPEKWTFKLNAHHQKLDGLLDITGDPAGSFALARAAFGGIQDIGDYSDTELTTATVNLDYTASPALAIGVGYMYEKYKYADAYSAGTDVFPAIGGFYLKANDGPYKANVVFAKLTYRF
ncbi:MAG: MtrB/PioB family outer membrane beta-barrel protein [Vicinamibacteria bacterium]